MLVVLQCLTKIVFTLGVIFGLVFMMLCTIFVVGALIRGDIRIRMVRDSDEKNI